MENTMKMYITADEVAELLGVSRGYTHICIPINKQNWQRSWKLPMERSSYEWSTQIPNNQLSYFPKRKG